MRVDADETGLWPATIEALSEGEHLLVAAFRRWIVGWMENDPAHWRVVSHDFAGAFGTASAPTALAALGRFVNVLRLNARRTIRYHQPCCPCLGADEACLVVIVAACQNGAALLARAACGWLVVDDAVGDLMGDAARLGQTLRQHGIVLPDRSRTPVPAVPATLH
jgi:hypothetical protein